MPEFHHSRCFAHTVYGVVRQKRWKHANPLFDQHNKDVEGKPLMNEHARQGKPHRGCDCDFCEWCEQVTDWEPCYEWIESRVGFFPLFLAVGTNPLSARITGYADQWRRDVKAPHNSQVLFSWEQKPHAQLVYQDFERWEFIMCDIMNSRVHGKYLKPSEVVISRGDEKALWKRSWGPADWRRKSHEQAHSVQAVVPELDLRTADLVRCRSQETRKQLVRLGWEPNAVKVERWPVWNP